MGLLQNISDAVAGFNQSVEEHVRQARSDAKARTRLVARWRKITEQISTVTTPTGLKVPRLALPMLDEPGEIARYLHGEGLPGEFPFVSAAYPEMYLEPKVETTRLSLKNRCASSRGSGWPKTRTGDFIICEHQRSMRLSTAFDGPTLYGLDSDADGVFGKIGEGGVAIDTIEDMHRLYEGFPLGDPHFSVSMTINGPAPIILAMYVADARRRFGVRIVEKLRGTIQADVLKEVQAQNEMIFPIEPALRFLGDMAEYTTQNMPRWYPISVSGYHIAEAGATPVQQAAYTLSNGFAYVDLFRERGMEVARFGPRLSFFLDCGLDLEYLALARVCRKIWAIGMRDVFGAPDRAQLFKLHTQTSGRSLIAANFKNNLTRTAIELLLACANSTNSCHSNSADEPFTTPAEEYVHLAAASQAIVLEETGLFKYMMNALSGSPGMKIVERAVEEGILAEFQAIDRLGGVLPAVEHRYQRSQIQAAAHRYETQISSGLRPIIGLNRYRDESENSLQINVIRTPRKKKQLQVDRLRAFKRRHAKRSAAALDRLTRTVETGGNVFEELIQTVEHCSLGQITGRLQELIGTYRPMV